MKEIIIDEIQLKRTKKSTLPEYLLDGEPIISTDSNELYIGQGEFKKIKQISFLMFSLIIKR